MKYFVVNPNIENQDKSVINELRREKETGHNDTFLVQRAKVSKVLSEEDNLIHVEGRVIVKIDIDSKDSWTFENGQKIEYKRRFNNFNQRETQPVNAIVVSGEGISKGAEILIHPNGIHDTNRIFDYKDSNDVVRYYAIQHEMCFAWHDGEEWQPLPPYDFALRIYEQHRGLIVGIEPTQIKNMLWCTTGKLKNKAVLTLVACDYEIIFQGRSGREQSLIRFRPFGDKKAKREEEAIGEHHGVTDKVLSGEYLVGYKSSNAKNHPRNKSNI